MSESSVVGILVGGPRHGDLYALSEDMPSLLVAEMQKPYQPGEESPDEPVLPTLSTYHRREFAWGRWRSLRVYVHESLVPERLLHGRVEDHANIAAMLFDLIVKPEFTNARIR